MKNKSLLFLSLGLGICSGTMLINRFVAPIPDWLAIVLMILAVASLVIHFVRNKRDTK